MINDKQITPVPIGKVVTSRILNEVLVVYGLGSCVAICVYDPKIHVAGILHALLPEPKRMNQTDMIPSKYVNLGWSILLNEVLAQGAHKHRLHIYLCGGAKVINSPGFEHLLSIGERNVTAAKKVINASGLIIKKKVIGGHVGRTIKLTVATGQLSVKSIGQSEQILE